MTDRKQIVSFPDGGQDHGGQTVLFAFGFSDGTEQMFECSEHLFPRLMAVLQICGALAAQIRSSRPEQVVNLTAPTVMNAPGRTWRDQLSIILEFGTGLGVPMQIAMSPDQAQRTIALLQEELKQDFKEEGGP